MKTATTTDTALPDEFAGIADEACAVEGGPPMPGTPAAEQAEAADLRTLADELCQALDMVRLMTRPLMSWWLDFDRVWSDATLRNIANGGAAVMQRHGLTVGELFATYGPYIALIGATAPPALATIGAFKQRRLMREHAARQPAQQPQQQPGATDGSPGESAD